MFYYFLFVNTNMNTFLGTFLGEKKKKTSPDLLLKGCKLQETTTRCKIKKKKKLCMYLKRRAVLDMKKCNDGE